jgi:hypothetical protein
VIITRNERSMGDLALGVPLEVFTEQEALAFLAERTGSRDVDGARRLAAELGYLPLALGQAAAVIAGQCLDYGTYLKRLRDLPTDGSCGDLALGYLHAGRTAEAIGLYEQLLADRERMLGSDHPDTLKMRNNLALAYEGAGCTD